MPATAVIIRTTKILAEIKDLLMSLTAYYVYRGASIWCIGRLHIGLNVLYKLAWRQVPKRLMWSGFIVPK